MHDSWRRVRKYEWFPGVVKNKFTSAIKAGTIATLETVGGTKITCTGETSTGEYHRNTKEIGKMVAKFTGCETNKLKCESPGAGNGDIVTSPLGGPIGFETEVPPPLAKTTWPQNCTPNRATSPNSNAQG